MSSKKRKSSAKSSAQPATKRPLRSNSTVYCGFSVPKTPEVKCKKCGDSSMPISPVDGMCPDCGFQPFMEASKHGPSAVLALLERGIEKKQELHPLEMALRKAEAKTPPNTLAKLEPKTVYDYAWHMNSAKPCPSKECVMCLNKKPEKAPRKQLATVAARYHYPGSGGHYGPHNPCPSKNCSRCTKPLPKKGDILKCRYCDIKISEHQDSNFCSCCDECFEGAWCAKCHSADKPCACIPAPYKIESLECYNTNCRHTFRTKFLNTRMFFASAEAYCSRRCALDDSATPPKAGECDCDKRFDSEFPHGAKCNARDWINERLGLCSACEMQIPEGKEHAGETATFCSEKCALKGGKYNQKSPKIFKKGDLHKSEEKEELFKCESCDKSIPDGEELGGDEGNFCSDACVDKGPKKIPKCVACGDECTDEKFEKGGDIYCNRECYNDLPCCDACGSRMIDGGRAFIGMDFCNAECYQDYQEAKENAEKAEKKEKKAKERKEKKQPTRKCVFELRGGKTCGYMVLDDAPEQLCEEHKKAQSSGLRAVACGTCDKFFAVKDGKMDFGRWFCNDGCVDIYRENEKRKKAELKCVFCSEKIIGQAMASMANVGDFCDSECMELWKKRQANKKCVYCSKDLIGEGGARLLSVGGFCGVDCLHLWRKKEPLSAEEKKAKFAELHGCWMCDKKFELKDAKKEDGYFFCCEECLRMYRGTQEKASLPKALMAMRCAGCNTNMIAKTSNAFKSLYCSDKCAAKHGKAKIKKTSVPCDFCSTKFVPSENPENREFPEVNLCSYECIQEHKAALKSQETKQGTIVGKSRPKDCTKACQVNVSRQYGKTYLCPHGVYYRGCINCHGMCSRKTGSWKCVCGKRTSVKE